MPTKTELEARLVALEERLRSTEERLESQADRLGSQKQRLDHQKQRLDRQVQRLDQQSERLSRLSTASKDFLKVHDRMERQVGAMEERLAEGLDTLAARGVSVADERDAEELEELLRDVRDEQARSRTRFGVVVSYEERVRRLEDALTEDANAALLAYRDAGQEFERRHQAEDADPAGPLGPVADD